MMAIHYVPLSPRGFSKSNIALRRAFYLQWEIFQTPSGKIVAQAKGSPFSQLPGRSEDESPDTQLVPVSEISYLAGAFRLPWSHYVQLLAVDNSNARGFYEAEALRGEWSVRQLRRQIGSQELACPHPDRPQTPEADAR